MLRKKNSVSSPRGGFNFSSWSYIVHFLSRISKLNRFFRAGGKNCIFQSVRYDPGFKADELMKTVYSEKHALHCPTHTGGETGPTEYFEKPDRAYTILK